MRMPAAASRPVKGRAGELAALVGVEDLRSAEAAERFFECRDAERGVHGVGQPPRQHRPARPVHDRHQIEEAARKRDIGDVRAPDLVRPLDRKTAQQVRKILCPGAGFVVRGFGPSAAMPILRISRCTRLRLTTQPSARSIAVIRREPRNGQAVNNSSIRRISAVRSVFHNGTAHAPIKPPVPNSGSTSAPSCLRWVKICTSTPK